MTHRVGFVGRMGPPNTGGYTSVDFTIGDKPTFVSFSRASSANYVSSTAQFPISVGIDTPRYDYNPSTLAPRGLLQEISRTNLLLNSETLNTQSVTVTAASHTLTFYGTGSVTLSGAATGTLNGSGAFPTRSKLVFTPSAGSLTLTVTGSVLYAQLELGGFETSYITTTGSTVTRAAEFARITDLSTIGFNQTEGTLIVEYEVPVVQTDFRRIAVFSDGTVNNTIELQASATNWRYVVVNGGATQFTAIGPAMSVGIRKFAIAYKASDFALVVDGGTPVTSASGTVPTVDRFVLGYLTSASYNGWYRRISYYPTRMVNAQLQAMTT